MDDHELDPSVEVAHLRRLLDMQPGCLMRLGADGTVLAVNDAAVTLLGVASRAQALGHHVGDWLPAEARADWDTFTRRVLRGGAASLETDVEPATGEAVTALFRAVPLADHPDGIPSIIVAVRAVSGQRQVEAAMVELEEQLRQRDAQLLAARGRLAEEDACRQKAHADLQAREQALASAEAARRAAEAECARQRDEVRQLQIALEAFGSRRHQASDGELEEARTARQRSEALLQETRAACERSEALLQAAQQALAVLEQREHQAVEERDALMVRLDEVQADCQRRESERDALQARLAEAQASCRERERELREQRANNLELAAAHAAAVADHDRFVAALREQAARLGALAHGVPDPRGGPRGGRGDVPAPAPRREGRP